MSVGELKFFVVGEVEFEFEQCGKLQQLFSEFAYLVCHSPFHLCDGEVVFGTAL